MQVLVSSDDSILCDEELGLRIEGVVVGPLDRFRDAVSQIEVQLSALRGRTPAQPDRRCHIEAQVTGLRPIAVSHEALTLSEAIHAATDKLKRALTRELRHPSRASGPGSNRGASRPAGGSWGPLPAEGSKS